MYYYVRMQHELKITANINWENINLIGLIRVPTKWLNLLHKNCAIFAQIFFFKLLRYFCTWNAMSFARFYAIFAAICEKPEIFFAKVANETKFWFCTIFFAQNRKFYKKCNFLGKLSKIDILSLELNNWRYIPYIKKNINIWV